MLFVVFAKRLDLPAIEAIEAFQWLVSAIGEDRHAFSTVSNRMWEKVSAISFGLVLRFEANDVAGVGNVTVAPLVVRDGIEDIVSQFCRRLDATFDHLTDIPLAAPDRKLARIGRAVDSVYQPDSEADY